MEEAVTKPRYPRSSLPSKRRGRSTPENSPLAEKIMRQLILSICLLVIIGTVKNINTSFTNFVTGKIKAALFMDIDVQKLFKGAEDFLNRNTLDKPKASNSEGAEKSEISATDEAAESSGLAAEGNNIDSMQGENISQEKVNEITQDHPFILPVEGIISSPFGERIHPLTKKLSFHQGVDLEANKGDPIKAALAGTVEDAGVDVNLGNFIRINHGEGIHTVYAHCSKLLVKKGNKIKQGDVIAQVGDTGLAVGTHLHFEVWVNDTAVNPVHFIKVKE